MCLLSVQFSHLVMSNSLRPHGLQQAKLPCPSPTPRAYSNSRPSHQWCHPTILSSVVQFSSHSLAYEIIQLLKTNHTTFHGHCTPLCDGPHSWSVFLSESNQVYILPIAVSVNEIFFFFFSETSRTWVSLGPETRHRGFWPGSSPGQKWVSD